MQSAARFEVVHLSKGYLFSGNLRASCRLYYNSFGFVATCSNEARLTSSRFQESVCEFFSQGNDLYKSAERLRETW